MRNFSFSHHAYIAVGNHALVVPELSNEFENRFQIKVAGNPDVSFLHYESFGIDESRRLQDMQSARPVFGDRKIFVISTYGITVQAQNAMLKMFEEPAPSTHFFIVVPSDSFIIGTLSSRLMKLDFVGDSSGAAELIPEKFLKMTYPERLKTIEKFLKTYKDSKENKSMISTFFNSLQALFAKDIKKNREHTEKLLNLSKYTFDTSASLKILLETTALTLPIL